MRYNSKITNTTHNIIFHINYGVMIEKTCYTWVKITIQSIN